MLQRHQLLWAPGDVTCISSKVGNLDCVICVATLPWNALLAVIVLSWYLHQPESHKLSLNKVSDSVTNGPKDRTPGLHGSDKNCQKIILVRKLVWGRSSLGPNFFDPAYASCKPCKFFLSEKGDKSFVRGLVACIWKVDRSMPRLVSCLCTTATGSGGGWPWRGMA